MTTAPPPNANLPHLCLDDSNVMKRHHQTNQALTCSGLLIEYLGLVLRGVGGVHQVCEQKLRLRCVILYCVVLIELRNRKLPCGFYFKVRADSIRV